jgi:diphosphoinositol-polyphosphate diphosphatase
MQARTGREKQRYNSVTGVRQVSGCVPIRVHNEAIELMLVQSLNRGDWIVPKGGWEVDESAESAAQREAYEEAGVQGRILFEITAAGEKMLVNKKGVVNAEARFYALLVEVELDEYPECLDRVRKWVR